MFLSRYEIVAVFFTKSLLQLCQTATESTSEKWIVVDSDGEEDDDTQGGLLHENDLVAFFNQMPLDNFFKLLLGIEQRDNKVS